MYLYRGDIEADAWGQDGLEPGAPGKRTLTMSVPAREGVAGVPMRKRDDGTAPPVEPATAGEDPFGVHLIGGGDGLPAAVGTKMEAAFGADFSSVRVHRDSAQPAAVGARAFAWGEELHFAPGAFDADSATGQELIGHELAHVVQQREGRVAVPQGKDGAIADDPALEREADELGGRAARGESVAGGRAGAAAVPPSTLAAQRKAIQRKVGFEFETSDWNFRGKMNNQDNFAGIAHTKRILIDSADGLGGAGADNGHVEFITNPLTSEQQVRTAVGGLITLGGVIRDGNLGQDQLATAAQRAQRDEVQVTAGGALSARPQATIGMTVTDMPELYRKLLALQAEQIAMGADDEAATPVHDVIGAGDADAAAPGILLRAGITQHLQLCLDEAGTMYDGAILWAQGNAVVVPHHDDAAVRAENVAFLSVIFKTLWDAWRNAGAGLDDAKYAFTMMPRTDFRTMFTSLSANAQATMAALWGNGTTGPLAREINATYALDSRMYSHTSQHGNEIGGFVHAHQRRYGPTKRAWLDSTIAGRGLQAQNKDVMSPPAPYPQHQGNPTDEGLGAMGADTNNEVTPLMLFELRNLAEGARVAAGQWEDLAVSVYRLAALAQAPRLAPPVPAQLPAQQPDDQADDQADDQGEQPAQLDVPMQAADALALAIPVQAQAQGQGQGQQQQQAQPMNLDGGGGGMPVQEGVRDADSPPGPALLAIQFAAVALNQDGSGTVTARGFDVPAMVVVGTAINVGGARKRITEINDRFVTKELRFVPA